MAEQYTTDGIKRGIEAAKINIKTFEDAIEKEKDVIRQLQFMEKKLKEKEDLKAKGDAIGKFIESQIEDGSRNNSS